MIYRLLRLGATGFIAVWVVRSLLQRGFTVIGTARSTSKGEYVKNLFEKDFPGKFSYVIIEDIAKVRYYPTNEIFTNRLSSFTPV